jgi:hypothetical protein
MSIDVDEKKSISIKNIKYKNEQDKIYKLMLKKIKYNNATNSFFADDVDREYVIDELYKVITKCFHFDVWGRINMEKDNSHISLVKKIFITRGYELELQNVIVVSDDKKVKRKKYLVTKK